jgi:hypothetical protein
VSSDRSGFLGKFRNECLNAHWFITMAEARLVIEAWRIEHYTERPRRSLGDLAPAEYPERGFARNEEVLSSTADSDP